MTFINQYEHLLDYSDNLNMQFIGSVEYLDRDLLIILNQLGVKDVKHFQYLEKSNKNSFYYNNFSDFNSFYDNEMLNKINELFKTDFDCFGFKMINDSLSIDQKPVSTDVECNDINNIKKECFVINLLETHKENKKKLVNKSNSEFCEIVEGLYNSNLSGNLAYSSKKEEIKNSLIDLDFFHNINNYKNIHNRIVELLNEKTFELNKKENCLKTCNKCNNFICYNEAAFNAHLFFCKLT
jgi:hypothetical protein